MPTPRMRSGIRACCRLEKRAARHQPASCEVTRRRVTSNLLFSFNI